MIRKKPEEFKIACLQDIRSLWPPTHNPFYAGFGNRASDVIAYREAGVPNARIMIINPQGEIHTSMREAYCWATYPKLLQARRLLRAASYVARAAAHVAARPRSVTSP